MSDEQNSNPEASEQTSKSSPSGTKTAKKVAKKASKKKVTKKVAKKKTAKKKVAKKTAATQKKVTTKKVAKKKVAKKVAKKTVAAKPVAAEKPAAEAEVKIELKAQAQNAPQTAGRAATPTAEQQTKSAAPSAAAAKTENTTPAKPAISREQAARIPYTGSTATHTSQPDRPKGGFSMRLFLIVLVILGVAIYFEGSLSPYGDTPTAQPQAQAEEVTEPASSNLQNVPDAQLQVIRDVFAPEMQ